ncbi:hypothetical protein DPMN_129712 [Dreissena polymorpha]|uniref:Uncharacterized protein n=1 Tax=Dreissena polymorpha TaxID=45954 RepID=A0A9D4H3B0_DREPO|nr:hypothetical protein DPMN_129712 [Dreissena polymorpha]
MVAWLTWSCCSDISQSTADTCRGTDYCTTVYIPQSDDGTPGICRDNLCGSHRQTSLGDIRGCIDIPTAVRTVFAVMTGSTCLVFVTPVRPASARTKSAHA